MLESIVFIFVLVVVVGALIYGYLLLSGTQKYGASFNRSQNEKQITEIAKGSSFLRVRYLSSDFNEIIHIYRQGGLIFGEIKCHPGSYERDILDAILSDFPRLEIQDEKIFSIPPKVIVEIVVRLFDELQFRKKFLRIAFH